MEEIDLNPTDEAILSMLRGGRCSPAYIAEQQGYSRQNVTNRLGRLVEHGVVRKLHAGLYELADDPDGGIKGYILSVTDEQLDAIADNDVAVIETETARYLLVHTDHEDEAIAAAEGSDADVVQQEVKRRE